MNYGLMLSCRLEELLQTHERPDSWTPDEETALYDQLLQQVMEERPEAWASGNIRIGDYILLSRLAPLLFTLKKLIMLYFSRQ